MKPMTLAILLAVAATCFAAGGEIWDRQTKEDRKARVEAAVSRCNKAVADNERIAQVGLACARDETVKHYNDVNMLLYSGFVIAAAFSVLAYSRAVKLADQKSATDFPRFRCPPSCKCQSASQRDGD